MSDTQSLALTRRGFFHIRGGKPMPRNPVARGLSAHRQQIIPDKREAALRKAYDDIIREEVPDDLKNLLKRLD